MYYKSKCTTWAPKFKLDQTKLARQSLTATSSVKIERERENGGNEEIKKKGSRK